MRWISGHRTASAARDAQELDDIHRNNEVDRLAKLATALPLPLHTPETPPSISVGGTEAPTPASGLWPSAPTPSMRASTGQHGCRCSVRRHMWMQWVWGNVRWSGCSPPWERCKVLCPLCSKWHRGTTHARLAQCDAWLPVFVTEWVRTWDTWSDLAQHWISTASAEDLDHISKLRVPQSFIDTVPRDRLHALRYRVAWHQYHMAHAVILLRQSLPMPPGWRKTQSIPRLIALRCGILPSAGERSSPMQATTLCTRRYTTGPLCQRKPPGTQTPGPASGGTGGLAPFAAVL